MDRRAIAAIIIGFGATVAAMVMPKKYSEAPKVAVELSWWGGALLIVTGGVVLMTEFTFADLGAAAHVWSGWIWNHLTWLLGLPGSWVVAAFAAGIAVQRWHGPVWKALPRLRPAGPQVLKWFTPREAVEIFVKAEIVTADRAAQEKVKKLRETVQRIETNLVGELEPEKGPELRVQLAIEINNRDDAEYVAKRRRTDVVDSLLITLKMGLLIGKGYPMKHKKGVWAKDEVMIHIPATFWKVTIEGTDILNLETASAVGYLGSYDDVLIGKNEDYKITAANMSSGPVVSHPF